MEHTSHGVLHSINVSNGGVPKKPRTSVQVTTGGLEGDRQNDLRYHGGPDRAVSIYSLQLIHALQAEGHPISPGSIGENLTLSDVDWAEMGPGVRLGLGTVVIELTKAAAPCEQIAGSLLNRHFVRVSEKVHPGWSRFYARVLREGTLAVGDRVVILPPGE